MATYGAELPAYLASQTNNHVTNPDAKITFRWSDSLPTNTTEIYTKRGNNFNSIIKLLMAFPLYSVPNSPSPHH